MFCQGPGFDCSERDGRLEVVAEGLPLHVTLVFGLRRDGAPRPSAATTDGVALQAARRRKERFCPELVGPRGRNCDFHQVVF